MSPGRFRCRLIAVICDHAGHTRARDDERARQLPLGRLPLSTGAEVSAFAMYSIGRVDVDRHALGVAANILFTSGRLLQR